MLKLIDIKKNYKVGDTIIKALRGVTLSFRPNEFVAILGPSGCGKTTLLNIIGGLDKYSSGDMQINDKSTRIFNSHDWDVYRNHRVGFIFQSYNLIPHQTVLGNVELALTIAGIGKKERVARAKEALDQVGLSDQYYKKPNQLSGGQCQRVAIARALVNNPAILLADEPTGALDTKTSKQIMDLIQRIANERLVIMVTHNPELASQYANRTIRLLDGELLSDSNPYSQDEQTKKKQAKLKNQKEKAKMSFFTAFKLSLQNLFTKKRRTVITSVAGAIGIIGISLVLSISYGLESYINKMQNDMLSGNPIEITESALDINALFENDAGKKRDFVVEHGFINVDSMMEDLADQAKNMENMLIQNNINQDYVEYIKSIPEEQTATILFDYGIDISNNLYTDFVGGDNSTKQMSLSTIRSIYSSILSQIEELKNYANLISGLTKSFAQAPDASDEAAEDYIRSQYNVEGEIAKNKNEIMVVLGKERTLADIVLAQLGYYSQNEFINIVNKAAGNDYDEDLYNKCLKIKNEDIIGKTFTWYENDAIFSPSSISGPFSYDPYYNGSEGLELTITGILEPRSDLSYGMLSNGFYYTSALAEYIFMQNWDSQIITKLQDEDKVSYTNMATYMPENALYPGSLPQIIYSGIVFEYDYYFQGQQTSISLLGTNNEMELMMGLFFNPTTSADDEIKILATTSLTCQQLGGNIAIDTERDEEGKLISWQPVLDDQGAIYPLPNRIAIYPLDFDQKELVLNYLDVWNSEDDILINGKILTAEMREEITYTDMLSLIISMIKALLQIITIALIGFTSLALLVSCVMIGIITFISVMERIKEIGVIRSIGGRKLDIANLFIAETFIIGFVSGMFGIIVTYIISGLINIIANRLASLSAIAVFPISYAVIMLSLSVGLTLISGILPAIAASNKDPVVALRTE